MTLLQLIRAGGLTMYILILCSVFSLAIIVERILYYRKRSKIKRPEFMTKIAAELQKGDVVGAQDLCKKCNAPFAVVVAAGLSSHGHGATITANAMEREIIVETGRLERFISIVGTIGSTAVYIGLFGTVLGIMHAFHDISQAGFGGINVVINGIAEALVCTAAGLAVAVPAVIAYNHFRSTIDSFVTDMELAASQTLDLLNVNKSK